jgi:uncharacterized protein (DUF433 family)
MGKDYVEKRDGGFWIAGKRVSLDTIAYAHMAGYSPEEIEAAFPAVTLEEIHGAIAFYLANRAGVEATFPEDERELDRLRSLGRARNPDFQTAGEAELAAKSDLEVLRIAAAGGRILVTHDWRTMPPVFEEFTTKQQSSGVLIVPQRLAVGRAIEKLLLVWAAADAEDWENVLCPIPF